MNTKNLCALFDMDGVVLDTEPLYDILWNHLGEKYNSGYTNFAKIVKGTTLPNIIEKYFSHCTSDEIENLKKECVQHETEMTFPELPGAIRFINELKANGIKVGLVTSSGDAKMKQVYKETGIDKLFDTIVTAGRIINGKPAPDCYLLAAKDLNISPQNCLVFEDSLAGIDSGKAAGMKVVGVEGTFPLAALEEKECDLIINSFENFTYTDFQQL